jgi:hypothetical protein
MDDDDDDVFRRTVDWAIANGITTVFHAATRSWEPGLRSGDNARLLLETISRVLITS